MTFAVRKRRTRPPVRRRRPPLRVDIVVASPLWTAQHSAQGAAAPGDRRSRVHGVNNQGELAIVLTDDSTIRALNRDWRAKDAATNVLSFPAKEPRDARGTPRLLGDIVIAYETTEREARAEHKPFAHHLAHLAVHGFLHLAGYDHEADDEAAAMERLETAILCPARRARPLHRAQR